MFQRIRTLFLVCLMVIVFGSVQQELVAQEDGEPSAHTTDVIHLAENFWNTGDVEAADQFLAPDYVRHDPGLINSFYATPEGMIVGLEAFKTWVAQLFESVPDFHVTIEDMVAEGDKIGGRYTLRGTFAPTGLPFEVSFMNILRIRDGLIIEEWLNGDNLGWERQIGLLPAPEEAPDADEDDDEAAAFRQQVPQADVEANKALLMRYIEEGWNQGNVEVVLENLAPDFVFHRHAWKGGDIIGLEATRQWAEGIVAAIPDFHVIIEDMVAEGNKLIVRYTLRGTFAPTGLPFSDVSEMWLIRFADGQFAEIWEHNDDLGLQLQAGILTRPEPEPTEDFSNVFFMSLSEGLNMISLPLKPVTPHTARSFAQEVGATIVIQLDEKTQRFVGFTLDAPDDGFPIEGGKGYIVNLPQARQVAFVGAPWTNQPPVSAAPPLAVGVPERAWAFVVSGQVDAQQAGSLFSVVVRNLRTNAVAADVVRGGYFAAAFADLSRQSVVEVGDRLEVTVIDGTGELASEPMIVTVTPETLRQAFVPVTLTNVGKPRQSLLLQNYPNPFNPETWMPYQLGDAAQVTIQIYSAQGGLVRTLNLGHRPAGFYRSRSRAAYWDGKNDAGESVASGVYFYQLRAGDFSATRRMLVVK